MEDHYGLFEKSDTNYGGARNTPYCSLGECQVIDVLPVNKLKPQIFLAAIVAFERSEQSKK